MEAAPLSHLSLLLIRNICYTDAMTFFPIYTLKEGSDMMIYLQMLETSEEKIRFEELVHTYKNLIMTLSFSVGLVPM